jgi:hypothetical protein
MLAIAAVPTQSAARCPDLALVLAIDGSGSIGPAEFQLQLQGYAAAFRSASVQQAIQSAGQVEVAVVLWADADLASQVMHFRDVSSPQWAANLADSILRIERRVTGNTGIGRGLWTALDQIDLEVPCALRRVVNVSGDGKETHSPRSRNHVTLPAARERAERTAVIVNALAIQTEFKDLAQWYGDNLLVGPGSFAMQVSDLSSFADAIKLKLVREISPPMLAAWQTDDFRHFD